ncbi:MAG: hypothetical protein DMG65_17720 [Candidatus Angelobacter sp. Gp1-AA117]|nr:MAG: hypothetical protein DMG65_17720 [Candidatus Angelobacter sp. Gp1-AA117]
MFSGLHQELISKLLIIATLSCWGQSTPSSPQQDKKIPERTIFVRGAVPSATDTETPVPENGVILNNVYTNQYFHLSYPIPSGWHEEFKGPPPSDHGYYVLAELRPAKSSNDQISGTILIQAQDLFFTLLPAGNVVELIRHMKETLGPEYKVERPPAEIKIANRPFIRLDYVAPVAGLHFYVLATEARCHALEFVFTSRDPALLEKLIQQMDGVKFTDGNSPVCIGNYAGGNSLTYKVDPVLKDRRFNPIPGRVIISKEGKVKHVHFISAFPDQAEIIKQALLQWKFNPYMQNGQPSEVETGILFGAAQTTPAKPAGPAPKSPD